MSPEPPSGGFLLLGERQQWAGFSHNSLCAIYSVSLLDSASLNSSSVFAFLSLSR